MGKAEFSSGDTNASIVPSRASAMWLTLISSGTGMANSMRVVGTGRRARNHVTAATATSATAAESQSRSDIWRRAAIAPREIVLDSVPERALKANRSEEHTSALQSLRHLV